MQQRPQQIWFDNLVHQESNWQQEQSLPLAGEKCEPIFRVQYSQAQLPNPIKASQARQQPAFHFKKDAVWKPLLRQFRRYLKKDALSPGNYAVIRLRLLSEQGYLLCQAMGVPEELARQVKTQHAVLMMVNSHRITCKKQLVPAVRRLMGKYAEEIWMNYFEVFNENS